jgi:predicted alpha/beta hydrolase
MNAAETLPSFSRRSLPLSAADGYILAADQWLPAVGTARAAVVINPATAVKAAYYHRFAAFLAQQGYAVLTYDYRGIGASRGASLRRQRGFSKLDWGRFDCDAALAWARQCCPDAPVHVVAHSIGGLLVGLAANNRHIARCLTVGAQYAYWPDYAQEGRVLMWLRWHLLMPLMTALLGYFPARWLGWHEDLPAAAAYEWAFRPATLEQAYRRQRAAGIDVLAHFDTMIGDTLAIGLADDPFGTPAAIRRLLAYFRRSRRHFANIAPQYAGVDAIGHFAFFHERFRETLWQDALAWLDDGHLPPQAVVVTNAEGDAEVGRS